MLFIIKKKTVFTFENIFVKLPGAPPLKKIFLWEKWKMMDALDKEILRLLAADGRMTVKEIAQRVSLTSPAVSERIHRMEKGGIIAGYTVLLGETLQRQNVDALISISVSHTDRQYFVSLVESLPGVRQCFHVTGSYSYIVKVRCADMRALEHMINRFQKLGQTSTQIILSTPVEHRTDLEIPARTHAPDA